MKKRKTIDFNLPGAENKLNLPVWLLFLFASVELIAVVQNILENNEIIIGYSCFTPNETLILVINIFAIVVYLFAIIFFNKYLEKIIKFLAIIGAISTFLMLFQDITTFEICVYLNALISATNSLLIITYLSMYFSIKSVICVLLISIFLYKNLVELLNNTIFYIPLIISIILMFVSYILFLISFVYFPQHNAKAFKVEYEEEKETQIALPSKQPPYFLYILLIIFIGLISGIQAITENLLVLTRFSNLLFVAGAIISAIFTFCVVLKKGTLKFFDLMYLYLLGFMIAVITRFFNNNIIYLIGSALLGIFSIPLSVTVILSAILFTKTNKITTSIWIICLNTISITLWNEVLDKIASFQGLLITLIPIIFITAIILRIVKPHLNFGMQQHSFEFKEKNMKENPFSYLSELELKFVILLCEGYTFNQVTEQLSITPNITKEIKLRVYGLLQVKTKKELVEKTVAYNI